MNGVGANLKRKEGVVRRGAVRRSQKHHYFLRRGTKARTLYVLFQASLEFFLHFYFSPQRRVHLGCEISQRVSKAPER